MNWTHLGFAEGVKKFGEAAQHQLEAQISDFKREAEKAEEWKADEERRKSRLTGQPDSGDAVAGDGVGSAGLPAPRSSPASQVHDFEEEVGRALAAARCATEKQGKAASSSAGAPAMQHGGATGDLADAGGSAGALCTPLTRPRHVAKAPAPTEVSSTIRTRRLAPDAEDDDQIDPGGFRASLPPPLSTSVAHAIAAARSAAKARATRRGVGAGGGDGARGGFVAGDDFAPGGLAPWELRLRSLIAELDAEPAAAEEGAAVASSVGVAESSALEPATRSGVLLQLRALLDEVSGAVAGGVAAAGSSMSGGGPSVDDDGDELVAMQGAALEALQARADALHEALLGTEAEARERLGASRALVLRLKGRAERAEAEVADRERVMAEAAGYVYVDMYIYIYMNIFIYR